MKTVRLRNGVEMPVMGFGTYLATQGGPDVLRDAISVGYRHFDTASFYQTEEAVGEALRKTGIPRNEMFLTSKAWVTELGDAAESACEQSLRRLGTDYLDLYLVHWPAQNGSAEERKQMNLKTWQVFQKMYRQGKVRAIGVSNFLPHHLLDLKSLGGEQPMVDQLEIHPGYGQITAVRYCQEEGIVPEAWSPLGRAAVLSDRLVLELAEKYEKSPAQICLRFSLQQEIVPLPKASSQNRMRENLEAMDFQLEEADLLRLLTMPQVGWSGQHPDRENV